MSAPKARLRIFLGIVPAVLPLDGLRSLVELIEICTVVGVMLVLATGVIALQGRGATDEQKYQ